MPWASTLAPCWARRRNPDGVIMEPLAPGERLRDMTGANCQGGHCRGVTRLSALVRRGAVILGVGLLATVYSVDAPRAQTEGTVTPVDLSALPWDATLVVAASVLTMRHVEGPAAVFPVQFSDAVAAALREPAFDYRDFRLTSFALADYVQSRSPAGSVAVKLAAVLVFNDESGRRSSSSLTLRYTPGDEGITVQSAELYGLVPPTPAVRFAIVPVRALPALPDDLAFDAGALLRLISPLAEQPTEARSPPAEEHYVFAFFLDRLPPDAKVAVTMDPNPRPTDKGGAAFALDFDGWRVAVWRGVFAPAAKPEVRFQAIYEPGSTEPPAERMPRVVATLPPDVAGGGQTASGPAKSK